MNYRIKLLMNSLQALRLITALLGLAAVSSARLFAQSADWQSVERETEKDGKLRGGVEAFKLTPADFSPLR